MVKKFTYGVQETLTAKNEKIKGIVIDFGTVNAADGVAPISNLNDISIDLSVSRNGGAEEYIFKGYLDELLTALYAQTPAYELNITPFGNTHKILITFLGGVLDLNGLDTFKVRMKAPSSSFVGLDLSKEGTYINVETIPAVGLGTAIPVIKAHAINNGDVNVDMAVGNNVIKIVAALDFTAPYTTSSKAKLNGIDIESDGYSRNVSREVLETENIHMFDNNPESPVAQMVLYAEDEAIHNVNIKGKLDQSADAYARILVVALDYL